MDAGISQMTQVVGVTINGTETFLRLGGSFAHFTLHELKELVLLLYATHQRQEKLLAPGEVSIRKLFESASKDHVKVGLINLDTSLNDDFSEYCMKNSLSYSVLYDVNPEDNRIVVAYSESQSAAFEAYMREHGDGSIPYSFTEYVNEAEKNPQHFFDIDKLLSEVDNAVKDKNEKKEYKSRSAAIINSRQVVAYTEDTVCISIYDEEYGQRYAELPLDRLKNVNDDTCLLAISDDEDFLTYAKVGFVNQPDNTYLDLRATREEKGQICDGKNLRRLAGIKALDIKDKEAMADTYTLTYKNITKTVDKNAKKILSPKHQVTEKHRTKSL